MTCSERKVWFALAFLWVFFPPFKIKPNFFPTSCPSRILGRVVLSYLFFFFFNPLKMK